MSDNEALTPPPKGDLPCSNPGCGTAPPGSGLCSYHKWVLGLLTEALIAKAEAVSGKDGLLAYDAKRAVKNALKL
jgi:hypothetical protein